MAVRPVTSGRRPAGHGSRDGAATGCAARRRAPIGTVGGRLVRRGVDLVGAGNGLSMLFVPEQRRPSLTRRRERYETTSDLSLAIVLERFAGWEIATALRDGRGALPAVAADPRCDRGRTASLH